MLNAGEGNSLCAMTADKIPHDAEEVVSTERVTAESTRRAQRMFFPRFPLFTKIVASFVLIIVFMVFSSIFILLQLREALLSSKTEVQQYDQSIVLSQQLERLFENERETSRLFTQSNESSDSAKYIEAKAEFQYTVDSLKQLTQRADILLLINRLEERHKNFIDNIGQSPGQSEQRAFIMRQKVISDSVRMTINALYEVYRLSLGKSLKLF